MPPRRAAAPPSPTQTNGRLVPPSPARSTRSTRSRRGGGDEDDWENESVASGFKVPTSRGGKSGSLVGLKDTSVNIAAAFHAAQTGHLPTPNSSASNASRGKSATPRPPSTSTSSSRPAPLDRELSPAEQIASSARALSPVRFFLRQTNDSDDDEEPPSGDFTSFSSLGNGNSRGEVSYDYKAEEELVRQMQAQTNRGAKGGRRSKGHAAEDLPYRPGEDDWQAESEDSDGEGGEGIVKSGALDGRAGTRGQRSQRGEGYLGMGLGMQPRQRRTGRNSGGDKEDEGDSDGGGGSYQHRGYSHSPIPEPHHREATPVRSILRAVSPRASPMPPSASFRRRRPSEARTMLTNLLHGLAISLRFIVELAISVLHNLFVRPFQLLGGSSRKILRRAKQDGWKYLVGLFALSLALRLAGKPWSKGKGYAAPTAPPGDMDELVSRLTRLESALGMLSDNSKALAEAEREGKRAHLTVASRVDGLESAVTAERKTVDVLLGDKGQLRQDVEALRTEVQSLTGRIGEHATRLGKLGEMSVAGERIAGLEQRMSKVEEGVRNALDDGRLRRAMEGVLPDYLPVRRKGKGGAVDVEPGFWVEMRKALVGRGEVEEVVRKVISQVGSGGVGKGAGGGFSEKELEAFGERLFDKKTKDGAVLSKSDFMGLLESELQDLRERIDSGLLQVRQSAPAPPQPPTSAGKGSTTTKTEVTIKSGKSEDLTPYLQQLIDAALLKYSKDTLARPDYALFTAGGRVVPSITSDTLVMRKSSALGKLVLGRKDVEGRSPATALHPDNSVGSCWPFEGGKGQLGVLLSRRVQVGDLTVEHVAAELVAGETGSAPRDIEVWGLVEGEDNKRKVQECLETHPSTESSIPPSPDHLLLASFTYDPALPTPIQTFPVPRQVRELGIDVGIVIFKVQSNWGSDFTCLYRVRVHGEVSEHEE